MNTKALSGALMMLVGILLFLPGLRVQSSQLWTYMLVPAAALLTWGTYRIGVSGPGRAV
ncbi:MAG: hypothetical protein ABEI99_12530 [Halobaculum sp.]